MGQFKSKNILGINLRYSKDFFLSYKRRISNDQMVYHINDLFQTKMLNTIG